LWYAILCKVVGLECHVISIPVVNNGARELA
jgi:hypothetical protein